MPAALSRPCLAAGPPPPNRGDPSWTAAVRCSEPSRSVTPVRRPGSPTFSVPQVGRGRTRRTGGGLRGGHRVRRIGHRGLARVSEADTLVKPDPATFTVLLVRQTPGHRQDVCDILTPEGEPSLSDPRHALSARSPGREPRADALHASGDRVLPVQGGAVPGEGPRRSPPTGPGTSTTSARDDAALPPRRDLGSGVDGHLVEFSHHEGAPGQHEIDLRYADALSTADNIMTFRDCQGGRAWCRASGRPSWPKPLVGHPGSGMHTHLSLFEGDRNAFHEPSAAFQLCARSPGSCIAGILTHAAEITAVTSQWVNSYKRHLGRRRGPQLRLLGAQQPIGHHPRPDVQAAEGSSHPHRDPVAGLRLQSLPRLRAAARCGPAAGRGRLRAPRRRRG